MSSGNALKEYEANLRPCTAIRAGMSTARDTVREWIPAIQVYADQLREKPFLPGGRT